MDNYLRQESSADQNESLTGESNFNAEMSSEAAMEVDKTESDLKRKSPSDNQEATGQTQMEGSNSPSVKQRKTTNNNNASIDSAGLVSEHCMIA